MRNGTEWCVLIRIQLNISILLGRWAFSLFNTHWAFIKPLLGFECTGFNGFTKLSLWCPGNTKEEFLLTSPVKFCVFTFIPKH